MEKYTYKESGVEWLGEIPEHWKVTSLKRVLSEALKYGANESAELEDKNLPRYIRITDFGNNGKLKENTFKSLPIEKAIQYPLSEGDILFARSGATVGKTFQFKNYKGKACYAGYLIKATPCKWIIDSDFLFFFTKSIGYDEWKNLIFTQATIQNIGADKYQYLPLSLPPLLEQKAIAKYLDKATAKIDRIIAIKQEQLVKMEEMRKSVFFKACTQGLKPNTNFIEINEGHITKMPSHWRYQRIKRGCKNIDTGKTPSSGEPEYFIDGTIEWFAPECFNDGLIIDKPKKLINEKAFEDNQIKIYPAQSVYFVAVGATAGKVGIIQKPSSCNQQINILETNFKLIPEFLAYQMKIIEKEIIKFAQYTTLPILNQAKTGYLQIAFPPIEEQKEIIEYLDNYTEKLKKTKASINSQIKTLQAYRKSLIHECVTGKKQVTEIYKPNQKVVNT